MFWQFLSAEVKRFIGTLCRWVLLGFFYITLLAKQAQIFWFGGHIKFGSFLPFVTCCLDAGEDLDLCTSVNVIGDHCFHIVLA